jgi:hypothetical protein
VRANEPRTLAQAAVAVVATVVALYSSWHSGGHVWRRLDGDYGIYSAYTDVQRRHAVLDKLPLPSDVFDFYAHYVGRGDRIYYQVLPSGFGEFCDLRTCVSEVGDYYLLPAVEVPDLRHATVVISYFADPALLKIHFPVQVRAGLNPFVVSRIRSR